MRTGKLLILGGKILHFLLSLFIFVQASISIAYSEESSSLWGRVFDRDQNPISQAKIIISSREFGFQKSLVSDELGYFRLCGFPSGFYSVRCRANGYHPFSQEKICFEPGRNLYLKITLELQGKKEIYSPHPPFDYSSCVHQTIIEKS